MARIRTIKPEFWEDEKIAELPMQARLMFIGCWNFADDYGVMPDSIKWLKAKVFPYDTLRDNELKQWLDALVKNRMIVRFSEQGKAYLIIRRFRSHQIIDKRYERSVLSKEKLNSLMLSLENPPISHSEHIVTTPPEGIGKEGIGNGKEGKAAPGDSLEIIFPFTSENFMELWGHWKTYKKQDHKFSYKSAVSEQAALAELVNLSKGSEETAAAIIKKSIASGWKGFFELKTEQNGSKKQPTGGEVTDFGIASKIANYYSQSGKS